MASGGAASSRRRNQRGDGARLRDEVIDAAMRILDRAPATTLSLRMVAKEAGVAAPSLYRQFVDAEAMTREIVFECWQQVATAMAAASAEVADEPPLRRLQVQMAAYVSYAMLRPSRYQLLFAPHIDTEDELEGPLGPVSRVARALIEAHHESGGHIPGPDPLAATVHVLSFVHGRIALAHLAAARPGNSAAAVEAFVRCGLDLMFAPAVRQTGPLARRTVES